MSKRPAKTATEAYQTRRTRKPGPRSKAERDRIIAWVKTLDREQRSAIEALTTCAYLTLSVRGKFGAGMMFDLKTRKVFRWEDDFMNALDTVGVVVDRAAYYRGDSRAKREAARDEAERAPAAKRRR